MNFFYMKNLKKKKKLGLLLHLFEKEVFFFKITF